MHFGIRLGWPFLLFRQLPLSRLLLLNNHLCWATLTGKLILLQLDQRLEQFQLRRQVLVISIFVLNSIQLSKHFVCFVRLVEQVGFQVERLILQELLQFLVFRPWVDLFHDLVMLHLLFVFFLNVHCFIQIHGIKRLDMFVNAKSMLSLWLWLIYATKRFNRGPQWLVVQFYGLCTLSQLLSRLLVRSYQQRLYILSFQCSQRFDRVPLCVQDELERWKTLLKLSKLFEKTKFFLFILLQHIHCNLADCY